MTPREADERHARQLLAELREARTLWRASVACEDRRAEAFAMGKLDAALDRLAPLLPL